MYRYLALGAFLGVANLSSAQPIPPIQQKATPVNPGVLINQRAQNPQLQKQIDKMLLEAGLDPNGKKQIERLQKEIDKIFKDAGLDQNGKQQIDQLQKEIDKIFKDAGINPNVRNPFDLLQRDLDRLMQQPPLQPVVPNFGPVNPNNKTFVGTGMAWGGMKLDKVAKKMQEDLGLPEKEGLVVNGVDAGSAAEKAGVKLNDILVRIGKEAVPSDFDAFSKLVKDQKADALDIVVVRDGNEMTLKGAKMPDVVQLGVGQGGIGGFGGRNGAIRPPVIIQGGGIGRIGAGIGGINNGFRNLNSSMMINGARINRKQTNDNFSGEYIKDELKINLHGKIDNGTPKVEEITVQDGKETKKYTDVKSVPDQYQPVIRQIMPAGAGPFVIPALPNLENFPGLPVIPGVDR